MPKLSHYFVPAYCGDFRIEHVDDTSCLLTIEDPTEADRQRLAPFLTELLKREVLRAVPLVQPRGLTTIDVPLALREAGPLLAGATAEGAALWTAVRFEAGNIRILDGTTLPDAPDAVAAASMKEPKRGCPAPQPAERRAHEVLRTFSTRRQWDSYMEAGYMTAIGNASGKAYHVFHRGEAAARGLARCIVEARTGAPICAWDDMVPPAEEVLSLKLAVEHRERWLLQL